MSKLSYKKYSIEKLITHAKLGEQKALEILIRKIQGEVYAVFSHLVYKKEDISDLTQETLIRLAKSLNSLKEPKSFKAWLNQIINNVFNDYLRKKTSNFVEMDEKKLHEIKDKITCEPGQRCLFTELEKLVRVALLALPENLRITLVLREYEGLSYEDISKITNTAIGTVKSRLARARIKLQEELKEFI